MGIRNSERTNLFHVPYGVLNSEGTPGASFVDLKAKPSWIPVLPSCVGWPETQNLLRILNAPASGLMSLAADQAFLDTGQSLHPATLTSFVTLCCDDVATNTKTGITVLADFLNSRLDQSLQQASNVLQQNLDIDIVLELQPTLFHQHRLEGWSLTVLIRVLGDDKKHARDQWGVCMETLGELVKEWKAGNTDLG